MQAAIPKNDVIHRKFANPFFVLSYHIVEPAWVRTVIVVTAARIMLAFLHLSK